MTARILVLGGGGMLGHKIVQTLAARFPEVTCTMKAKSKLPAFAGPIFEKVDVLELDAMDLGAVERVLQARRPDFVINCVGVIKQRAQAAEAIPSIKINSLLPHCIAAEVAAWGGRLVHFSTDCVFSGHRGNYTEDDNSDAEDLYGRTKFLGEVTTAANALTLRTSIIGRELSHGASLVEWFLSQRGRVVRGFTRHLYSGVTTPHLSRLVADVLDRPAPLAGLFQVTAPPISKYRLLCLIRDAFKVDVEIVPDDTPTCDRTLVGERFDRAVGRTPPDWSDLLRELAVDPTPYPTRIAP